MPETKDPNHTRENHESAVIRRGEARIAPTEHIIYWILKSRLIFKASRHARASRKSGCFAGRCSRVLKVMVCIGLLERMTAPVFVEQILAFTCSERPEPLRTVRSHVNDVIFLHRIPMFV
jgi:hypothetical protein